MGNVLEPRLPDNYYPAIYIPVYSTNDGHTWVALQPCVTSTEAKHRLKSWMPSGTQMINDSRFVGLRVGCIGINISNGERFSVEFVPVDFVTDPPTK